MVKNGVWWSWCFECSGLIVLGVVIFDCVMCCFFLFWFWLLVFCVGLVVFGLSV